MRKTVDQVLWYRGEFNAEACCRIRVYKEDGKPPVVIASEMPENPGTALMLSAETLCDRLWLKLRKPPQFLYFEYRPGGESLGIELDQVLFERNGEWENPGVAQTNGEPLANPAWCPVPRVEVEELIGETLG